jgi:hypothetical protein
MVLYNDCEYVLTCSLQVVFPDPQNCNSVQRLFTFCYLRLLYTFNSRVLVFCSVSTGLTIKFPCVCLCTRMMRFTAYSASLHSRLRFLAQGLRSLRSGNEPPQSRRPVTNLPDVHYQFGLGTSHLTWSPRTSAYTIVARHNYEFSSRYIVVVCYQEGAVSLQLLYILTFSFAFTVTIRHPCRLEYATDIGRKSSVDLTRHFLVRSYLTTRTFTWYEI